MRGRKPSVDFVRDEFLYQISSARKLESAVRPLAAVHPNAAPGLHPKHMYRTVELAFMGVCAAWEDFLEGTMVRYLAGAVSRSGYKPTLRVGPCAGIQHAYQVLSGKPSYDPSAEFLSWTNPPAVIRLGAVFFQNGAPFKTPLQRDTDRLKQAVKIRNRVAHASEKCRSDFRDAANNVLQRPAGTLLGQGYRVGQLLSAPAGAFFGAAVPALGISIFEAYMRSFESLARDIVP